MNYSGVLGTVGGILALMSDEEVQRRKGQLLENHQKAKDRLLLLEADARGEAKALQEIVDWLESGGEKGSDSVGMDTSHYFSGRIVNLIENLKTARLLRAGLQDELNRMGYHVS